MDWPEGSPKTMDWPEGSPQTLAVPEAEVSVAFRSMNILNLKPTGGGERSGRVLFSRWRG